MAVYYACTQQRTIGRLLDARNIRKWIRGGRNQNRPVKYMPFCQCEPEDFNPPRGYRADVKEALIRSSFIPSISAVVTMAAPQALLSTSLFALLIALGVYLGFTWSRNLDPLAGIHDSRNVFIVYIAGLGVCLMVYSISSLVQDQDERSVRSVAKLNCEEWLKSNQATVATWGYQVQISSDARVVEIISPIGHGG